MSFRLSTCPASAMILAAFSACSLPLPSLSGHNTTSQPTSVAACSCVESLANSIRLRLATRLNRSCDFLKGFFPPRPFFAPRVLPGESGALLS